MSEDGPEYRRISLMERIFLRTPAIGMNDRSCMQATELIELFIRMNY